MNMKEVIEHLRLNGLHDEAAAVGLVMEQRAELLEALKIATKYAKEGFDVVAGSWQENQEMNFIQSVIKKCEAAQ